MKKWKHWIFFNCISKITRFCIKVWDIVYWKSAVEQKSTKIVLYRVDEMSKQYCRRAAYRNIWVIKHPLMMMCVIYTLQDISISIMKFRMLKSSIVRKEGKGNPFSCHFLPMKYVLNFVWAHVLFLKTREMTIRCSEIVIQIIIICVFGHWKQWCYVTWSTNLIWNPH